ncbi:MAG: LamG domain-containing protein, partial [Candidatus Marinimicrobia bacterium]|nr:LamG domain-containing protein [Candidatus Neomarinimicrobiota bacterium]
MNSVLHQKIVGNTSFGDRMPQGGSALAQADEEKIKLWIQNGAVKDWSGGAVSSYSFDFGPGPYIDVKAPIEGEQVWSIEAWVKFHQKPTTTDHEIFFLNNNANQNLLTYFFSPNSDKFRVELSGANALEASANEVFDTKFHHFYLEGNGSKIAIYIDGTNKAESDYTGSFPQSDKDMSIGYRLDASMDEIRFRKKSGFPGLPTARYNAEEGTWLLYQFDNQSTTQITDNSGQNNHGTIKGTAAYEDDVYSSGGGGTEGINVTYKSNETFSGKAWIGLVPQGNDPNYWNSTTFKWDLGDKQFPGERSAKVWNSTISDGEYHMIVFVDQDGDDQWNDATEYGASSLEFTVSNKQGNAGTLELKKGGGGGGTQGINLTVTSNETLTNEEILVGFMGPGQDPNYWANRSWDHSLGNYTFPGSQTFLIPRGDLLDGSNYHLLVFADLNNDKMLDDATEHNGTSMPFSISGGIGNAGNINLNAPGGGGTELYTDSVEVVIKSIAPYIGRGDLWLALYENEDTNPINALPGIPDNPIFSQRILDFDTTPIIDQIYTFKNENFDVEYDSAYAWIAYYYKHGAQDDAFDVNTDPYDWGYINVDRLAQGSRLNFAFRLHFVPGPEITPPSPSSIQANVGQELQLSFGASASQMTGSEVEHVEVEFWSGHTDVIHNGFSQANNNGDGTWTTTIPPYDINLGGLAIAYQAQDKMGIWSGTPISDIQVVFGDLPDPSLFAETNAKTYQMVSVPAVLQDARSEDVIHDELGSPDKVEWRLFEWSNGQYHEGGVSFTPGAAFWLITKNAQQINTGPGKTTPIFSTTRRNLSDGWNMVGNPYYFPVNLAEHVVFSENVEPNLYQWNGSNYTNTTTMVPRGGNWVFSNGSGMMEFFPMFKPQLQSEAIPEETVNDEEDFNWKAKIITKAGDRYDKTATFGVHESASDTWDRFDYHEPPVIGDYISMAFDNNSWTENGGSYSQDIRSEGRTQTWNLAARSNIKGIVSLSLEDVHTIPSHQD